MERRKALAFLVLFAASAGWLGLVQFGAARLMGSVQSRGDTLSFELYDALGRKIFSADYAGVPVFLEFGACW
jgi:hypothetical protein